MTSLRFEPASPADVRPAAALAARAMVDLPENRVVFRGREERMRAVFVQVFARSVNDLWVARDEAGALLGVMRVPAWPACKPSRLQSLAQLPGLALALKDTLPRAAMMHSAWARQDPQRAHLHLDPIAVSVDAQGRGVGSSLMERYCTLMDEHALSGYLETGRESSVRFYSKYGFEVTKQIEVLGAKIWLMWRELK